MWKQKQQHGKSYKDTIRHQYLMMLHKASKNITFRLAQLCLEHDYFREYLFNISNSTILISECQHCTLSKWENLKHLILECIRYNTQRKQLQRDIDNMSLCLSILFQTFKDLTVITIFLKTKNWPFHNFTKKRSNNKPIASKERHQPL